MGSVAGKINEETPKYTVSHKGETFEVREYGPCMAAGVTWAGDIYENEKKNNPFMVLARYIGVFSAAQNVKAESIAMTTPVVMRSGDGRGEGEEIAMTSPVVIGSGDSSGEGEEGASKSATSTMLFLLPSKYTSTDMVPKPTDPAVIIYELPPRKLAVIRFSGYATKSLTEKKEQELREAIAKEGFKAKGKKLLSIYNPPYTLPMFRTNEVSVPVE